MKSKRLSYSDINELVSYGPRLYPKSGAITATWHEMKKNNDGTFTLPQPEYPEVAQKFFKSAARDCWSDFGYEPNEAERRLKEPQFIERASLSEIKTLLTYCVRGERFCDGHWGMMIREGYICRILARLRERLPRFEHCALKYLDMWFAGENLWCEAMRGVDQAKKLEAMSKFATAYRIARNLHRKHDAGLNIPRFQPVLEIIEELTREDFRGAKLLSTIDQANKRISEAYCRTDLLSLTTKFLWLKFKSPLVIYDRQARLALGTKPGDLRRFYSKWQEQFESFQPEIATACASLRDVRYYSANPNSITPQFIDDVAAQQWFHERVFDIYLWTIGGNES